MSPSPSADDRVGRMEFLLSLRRHGITDAAVLRAMDEVPREHFVAPSHADVAYADQALPIACGQTISQPYVVAYMTERLAVRAASIACSRSAPARAIRPRSCRGSPARSSPSSATARSPTRPAGGSATLGYTNVEVIAGDGLAGAPDQAPFDRIIVTAAAEEVPQALVDQLGEGGIMVLPLGPHDGAQVIVTLTKTKQGLTRERPDRGAVCAAFARKSARIVTNSAAFG